MASKKTQKPKQNSPKMKIDSAAVRQLSDLLKDTDLSEIEYESEGCRIRVARHQGPVGYHHPLSHMVGSASQASAEPAAVDSANLDAHPGTMKSPMVGTVYLSPKPGDPPFVTVGATVTAGQTIMIIEAMKVMNPLKAPKSGKITHILVEDTHPVEFDEPLLIIE